MCECGHPSSSNLVAMARKGAGLNGIEVATALMLKTTRTARTTLDTRVRGAEYAIRNTPDLPVFAANMRH